jgi:two-component system sensor histidine kinase HydH
VGPVVLERFETSTERAFFVGLCATFVLAVVAAIASVRTQIGLASPGFVVWQNLIVPAIGAIGPSPETAAVPQRTVVTAVDGLPVRDAMQLRERVRARPPGSSVAYTFRRDGHDAAARVSTSVLRWRDVAPVYLPYLLEGMALLVTAAVIFLFRPRDPGARAGVALGTVAGLLQVLALDLFSAAWLQRLYFVVESLVPAVLLHFALCFPEEKPVVRRHPWLTWAVYAGCAPFAILQNWFLTRDPERHLLVNDWVYVAAALAGVVTMVALVHGLVTARSALARQQLKIVLAGMAAAVFVPALGLFAIILLGIAVPMNVLTPFFLLFPLSIAYAVGRHDLFRVDRYLRLGVAWAVLTVVVFASYAAVALAGQAWLGAGTRAPAVLAPLYVLAMLLVANPVRARVQAIVDRLFHRQGYSYRAAVEATSRALASVLDTDRIAAAVLGTLTDEMAAEWAVLAVLDDASGPPRIFGRPPARAEDVARVLPADAMTALRTRWARWTAGERPPAPYDRFARLGAALAFPLRFEDQAVGLLLVGDKLSAAVYTEEDLDLVQTLASQGALALVNARAAEVIRRTQAELAEAERLAAVGELASAVAHGIRNPLAGIRASAEVARDELGEHDGELRESLDEIIGEADRLETRVRTILDFTRPLSLAPTPGDLGAFLQRFADGLGPRLPPGVRVDVEVDPRLPAVAFDPKALGEVVETIAVNAVEAMRGAGAILLRAVLDPPDGGVPGAVVSVSDTGPGLEAEARRRVFDLFYTTKQSGTGVGLAMAKRLVERQGGTIAVESAPGAGATFRVRLPVASRLSARTS